MPKYTSDIIAGYTLYFTSKCTVEAMHVHASDKELSEYGSAKFYVYDNGDTKVERMGTLDDIALRKVQKYIKLNYKEMYRTWKKYADTDFYEK